MSYGCKQKIQNSLGGLDYPLSLRSSLRADQLMSSFTSRLLRMHISPVIAVTFVELPDSGACSEATT